MKLSDRGWRLVGAFGVFWSAVVMILVVGWLFGKVA